MVGLRGGFDDFQYIRRIEPNRAGQDNEFDDIDPALATFNTGNERLVMLELVGQFLLTEARLVPRVHQRPAKCFLSFASDRSRHASHTFRDVASG